MKNKILFIFFLFLYNSNIFAESIFIESKSISIDKNKETSIFENEVNVKTKDGYIITSDFAEYNKATGILILKRKITGTDKENNIILDPHTAVGVGSAKKLSFEDCVVLSTAHPCKFPDATNNAINKYEKLPKELQYVLDKNEKFQILRNNTEDVKNFVKSKA